MAEEAGFLFPVAVTDTVWAKYVKVDDSLTTQDTEGRLWDLLMMLRFTIDRTRHKDVVCFQVLFSNDELVVETAILKAVCGPGDDAEPVITIMLPTEDQIFQRFFSRDPMWSRFFSFKVNS